MSDYWKERIAQEMLYRQEEDTQIGAEMTKLFNRQYQAIQDEIDLFMKKYGDGQKITPAEAKKRVSEMDVVNFADKAKRYVQEKNFSPEANAELKIYNLKMKVSRFEMLQYHIDLEMVALADGERQIAEKYLNQTFVQEMNLQAGILGEFVQSPKVITHLAKAIIDTPYDGVVWSDRIWERQTALRLLVANSVQDTILRGRNAVTMARFLKQQFDVTGYQAKRLAVTETARVQTQVQKEMYKANQVGKYEFMAEPTACEICAKLDGKIFDTDDMTPGKNAAPMHPHCHCSTGPSVDKSRGGLSDRTSDVDEDGIYRNKDYTEGQHTTAKTWSERQKITNKIDSIDMEKASKDDIIELGKLVEETYQISEHLGNKEMLREIFGNFREMGGVVPDETWSKGTSRVVKSQLEEAFSFYPKDWAEIPKTHNRQLYVRKKDRGYFVEGAVNGRYYDTKMPNYREGYLTIVTDGIRKSTPYHEIGHMVEWANPNLIRLEKEYIDYRTKGERPTRLKDLFPLSKYRADEVVKKDDFIDPYIGKYYDDATEVLSMGLQGIYVPEEKFVKRFNNDTWEMEYTTILDDKEFLHFVIGLILKG